MNYCKTVYKTCSIYGEKVSINIRIYINGHGQIVDQIPSCNEIYCKQIDCGLNRNCIGTHDNNYLVE